MSGRHTMNNAPLRRFAGSLVLVSVPLGQPASDPAPSVPGMSIGFIRHSDE